ncbi:UNVERIFIED_CONTAM: hypothetical protein GTU68_002190, partial [Idotea baltica]|nr:hypothetical protein [Idotea baltica]
VVDGNKVEEFDFESENKRQLAGNIYLAKVTRVEPSLQAAFVDYGGNRHGFLAFSEIHPDYYQIPVADREALMIQEVIKVRQILLVQVVKEERGNKGAALTTYLSLAGRYCVLMPNTARGGGISRKITNAADRKKLKEIASEIDVPKGAGLIVRTAGAKRTKTEIKRDYDYLKRLWEQIRELTLKSIAPAKIYEEGDLIKRSIRDLYNREIDEVFVEGERGYRIAKDFMKMIMPSHAKNVKQYADQMPLFARYQVESYLAGMFNPTVQLKSGGYIVIGVTEALVAIDVNSGRATKEGSIEDTATKTNLEAAEEVARQLRLRDLAGLIVIDFIDMDERKNNAAVEKRLKDKLKTDRARIQVGRISGFGLLEMSRQRLRPGMIEATTQPCAICHGTGLIRSDDNMALSILRQIEEEGVRRRSREVLVKCPVNIANFLMNQKREHVAQIEMRYGLSVRIEGDPHLVSRRFAIESSRTADEPFRCDRAGGFCRYIVDGYEVDSDEDEVEQQRIGRTRRRRGRRDRNQPSARRRRRRRRRQVEASYWPMVRTTSRRRRQLKPLKQMRPMRLLQRTQRRATTRKLRARIRQKTRPSPRQSRAAVDRRAGPNRQSPNPRMRTLRKRRQSPWLKRTPHRRTNPRPNRPGHARAVARASPRPKAAQRRRQPRWWKPRLRMKRPLRRLNRLPKAQNRNPSRSQKRQHRLLNRLRSKLLPNRRLKSQPLHLSRLLRNKRLSPLWRRPNRKRRLLRLNRPSPSGAAGGHWAANPVDFETNRGRAIRRAPVSFQIRLGCSAALADQIDLVRAIIAL